MNTDDHQTIAQPLSLPKVAEADTAVLEKEKVCIWDGNPSGHMSIVYNIMLSLFYPKFNQLRVSTVFFLSGKLQ